MASVRAHRAILRGVVIVGIFAALGKAAGAAKEMGVAWRFGVSAEVDAYVFVLSLVNWPVSIWASLLGVILLPMAARLRRESPAGLRVFRAELLATTLVAGGAITVLFLVALPPFLASRLPGLPPHTAGIAVHVASVLGWLVLPGMLVGLTATWVMSSGRHLNTLFEGVPAAGILIGILIWSGVEPLVWGTLTATIVQFGLLTGAQRAENQWERPSFRRTSPHWVEFRKALGVVLIGQMVMGLNPLVDQFFAARLGEGAISSLGFANRVLSLALGLMATALTRATLPVFAETAAAGGAGARQLALRWAGLMGLIGLASAAVAWALAPWAIGLLYQRGTFTGSDTLAVSQLLRYGVCQLPFYFASLVLVSLHSSRGRYQLLMASGVVGLLVKLSASFLLIPLLGISGLMLSQALVYTATTILLLKADSR